MSTDRIIVHADDYLVDRLNGMSRPRDGILKSAFRRYKTVEVIVDSTRKFAAELFPDGEISRCTDDERQELLQAIKESGLNILENPEIAE